jgi:hypothetical protein
MSFLEVPTGAAMTPVILCARKSCAPTDISDLAGVVQ